jgi:hypothetical protein
MLINYKILGDKVIPGVPNYAFEALRSACSIVDPEESEQIWAYSRAIANQPIIAGKRVWYHLRLKTGDDAYISLNPGEYRTTRPHNAEDIVLPMPDAPEGDTLVGRMEAVLGFLQTTSIDQSQVDHVSAMLRDFTGERATTESGAEVFAAADKALRDESGDSQQIVDDLYGYGIVQLSMPLVEFSASMALLRLQAMMGRWCALPDASLPFTASGSPYREPNRHFVDYVNTVADGEDRGMLESVLAEIGNEGYREAGGEVKKGLNSPSMVSLSRHLVRADHHYWIALMTAKAAERVKISPALQYRVVQAEEGCVCTQTGVFSPMRFLFQDWHNDPKSIASDLAGGIPESSILFKMSSPIWPCFTRKFARVLFAHARLFLPGSQFDQGLKELLELENEYANTAGSSDVNFERGWIDSLLLMAYRKIGDPQLTRAYAARIAGQFIVQKAMARER